MQNFVKIGEVSRNGDLRYIRMWLTRNRNKLPTFLWIKVMLSNPKNYHHCSVCFYSDLCNYECKTIENSRSVRRFIEREYGLMVGEYCLTPMIVKRIKNGIFKN